MKCHFEGMQITMKVWATPITYISLRNLVHLITYLSFHISIWVVEPLAIGWGNRVPLVFLELGCEAHGPLDWRVGFCIKQDGGLLGWLVTFCGGQLYKEKVYRQIIYMHKTLQLFFKSFFQYKIDMKVVKRCLSTISFQHKGKVNTTNFMRLSTCFLTLLCSQLFYFFYAHFFHHLTFCFCFVHVSFSMIGFFIFLGFYQFIFCSSFPSITMFLL